MLAHKHKCGLLYTADRDLWSINDPSQGAVGGQGLSTDHKSLSTVVYLLHNSSYTHIKQTFMAAIYTEIIAAILSFSFGEKTLKLQDKI